MGIEDFDFVLDVPVEYMHVLCLGVVKRMVELTFDVGENRKTNVKRKLSKASDFNALMLKIKLVREFPRRARELDLAVMKASELRNIVLFFFPLVIETIQEGEKERIVWLLLVYMVRSCVLPSDEFNPIPLENVSLACERFYKLYEKLYGQINCTYSTHVVGAHFIEIRHHGPLPMTSAFPFESFYGEMRNSFTPGTQSQLKQIFQKILLKRTIGKHSCEKNFFFR